MSDLIEKFEIVGKNGFICVSDHIKSIKNDFRRKQISNMNDIILNYLKCGDTYEHEYIIKFNDMTLINCSDIIVIILNDMVATRYLSRKLFTLQVSIYGVRFLVYLYTKDGNIRSNIDMSISIDIFLDLINKNLKTLAQIQRFGHWHFFMSDLNAKFISDHFGI